MARRLPSAGCFRPQGITGLTGTSCARSPRADRHRLGRRPVVGDRRPARGRRRGRRCDPRDAVRRGGDPGPMAGADSPTPRPWGSGRARPRQSRVDARAGEGDSAGRPRPAGRLRGRVGARSDAGLARSREARRPSARPASRDRSPRAAGLGHLRLHRQRGDRAAATCRRAAGSRGLRTAPRDRVAVPGVGTHRLRSPGQ